MKNVDTVKMSFKKKMLLSFLPMLVFVFIAMTYFIYKTNDSLISRMAVNDATDIAHRYANQINMELTEYLTVARDFNAHVADYRAIDVNARRAYYTELPGKYLHNNPKLLSVWLDFEPNALDGKDVQYVNTPPYGKTGRFNIGWNNKLGYPACDTLEDAESELGEEYYTKPKEENNEVLLNPYYYSYSGKAEEEILMTTICMPVHDKSKQIVGVTGIDISLDALKAFVDQIKPFGSGYAMLVSNGGEFLSYPDPKFLGKKITDTKDYDGNMDMLPKIQAGQEFEIRNRSAINNDQSLEIFVPIKLGNTTTPMSLGISIPYKVIFAENESMLQMLMILCAIALAIIAIVVFTVANKLSKPLIVLSKEAGKLAEGNLDIHIQSETSDESGMLSNTINHVVEVLQELLKDINQIITNASAGKLSVRLDAEKYHGSYGKLALGVNTLLDNILSPINIAADYLNRLSKGDIPSTVTEQFNGDFNEIRNSLNGCIDAVGLLIKDTNHLVNKALDGSLQSRADATRHLGDYRKIIDGVNGLLDAVANPIHTTAKFLEMVAVGDPDLSMVEDDYKGEFSDIKNNINTTYNTLIHFRTEINKLLDAATSGELNVRADISSLQGSWHDMGNGVNTIFAIFSQLIADSGSVLATMSTGDLTTRMEGEYKGQFQEIKSNINNLGDSLNQLISNLASMIHTTASAAAQISASAEALALATQKQNSQTTEVAIAVDDMSRTAVNNAENANMTADLAKQSGDVANNGGKVVTQTVQKMREIADVVHNSALSIEHLGKSSKEIGEIIAVINDIADQTNLLALNAAIEAARAGEQGRGFAVVADEVRKLSERTAEATRQIADMINSIQTETELAVNAMAKGTHEVQSGIELADKAGSSLSEILNSTNKLLGMINHIAAASEEQSTSSEKIANNVNAISHVSAESAQNIEDVATTAAELARLTDDLNQMINSFKVMPGNPHNRMLDA